MTNRFLHGDLRDRAMSQTGAGQNPGLAPTPFALEPISLERIEEIRQFAKTQANNPYWGSLLDLLAAYDDLLAALKEQESLE